MKKENKIIRKEIKGINGTFYTKEQNEKWLERLLKLLNNEKPKENTPLYSFPELTSKTINIQYEDDYVKKCFGDNIIPGLDEMKRCN